MAWQLFRYKSDIAYYVYCDKCGQMFPAKVSRNMPNRVAWQTPDENMLYDYCPSCGVRNGRKLVNNKYYELYSFLGELLEEKVKVLEV